MQAKVPMQPQAPWAIVTGASRGIGRACALRLAAAGLRVVVCYGSNDEAARATCDEVEKISGSNRAVPHRLDLREAGPDVAANMCALLDQIGAPWALVHAAGIARDGLMARLSFEAWNEVLQVNLVSFWAVVRPVARAMLKAREGRIVTLASVAGLRGNAGQSAYAASKSGLIAASKSLALELAPRGITVNAVAPGFISTDMTAKLDGENINAHIPMRRMGTADEVACAVQFLCAKEASYITGEVIGVHGGLAT